jgi:alpha-1,3-glucosyltransferase
MAYIFKLLKGHGVVALRNSGQVASEESIKVWMRSSVLASEMLVWIPAVVLWAYIVLGGKGGTSKRSGRTKVVAILTVLLQPATILIDNGHFQYNTVMLGLSLAAVVCFQANRDLLGCFCFVASLCFKQMSLYYAPAVYV